MPSNPLTQAAAVASSLALAGLIVIGAPATAQDSTLTVEVVETGSRYTPDLDGLDADGNATRGTYYITEGYIYEAGTLTCGGGVCNGVVYDEAGNASPEFPDKVIGTWTCYGTHTEDLATYEGGVLAVSTQIFDLGDTPGSDTIVTSGFETGDFDVPVSRAVIGGTGTHSGATGDQVQTLLGFNNSTLVIDEIPLLGFSWTTDLPA